MTDIILTLKQLNTVFQSLVMSFLGTSNYGDVRVGWLEDGQPAWDITSDVTYLLVNYEDSPIAQQMETEYVNGVQTQTHIAPLRVQFEVYGPNSFDNASLIRSSLYLSSTKDTLAASNLSPIPNVPMPTRAPELFNAQWWPHVSFYARFYELVKREQTVDYIASADVVTKISE